MVSMWMEQIEVEGPYDFDAVLDRQLLDPLQAVDLSERSIKVPLIIKGHPEVVTVIAKGTLTEPSFEIIGTNIQTKASILNRLIEIFNWGETLHEINSHYKNTVLCELFKEHCGTAIVLEYDYFSNLTKSIIHQQLNLKFAYRLTERFVKTFGLELDGAWFYPSPEIVAELSIEQLRELQFSGRKAEYVIGLAQAVVSNQLNLESLRSMNDEQVIDELTKIRGIGKWTAESFLLFALGRPNVFPKADVGIQNALKIIYQQKEKPTMDQMSKWSKEWEPYLSYAALYLWRSTEKRSEK